MEPGVQIKVQKSDYLKVAPETRKQFLELYMAGLPFRPQPVRLTLNALGHVSTLESLEWIWCGVLTRVEKNAIWLRGWYCVARGSVEDELVSLEPEHYRSPPARLMRIPLHPMAHLAVNLDPVLPGRLRLELGQVVEVVPDLRGRARYVDVLKVNRQYYLPFMGRKNALYHDEDAEGRPTRLHRDRLGRWGFIEQQPAAPGEPPRRVRWAALNVRVYDQRRLPRPIEDWEARAIHAVAGVWVDPKSGFITHVFWSGTTE